MHKLRECVTQGGGHGKGKESKRKTLLAPIDADLIVLERLQAVDGAEGDSSISRIPIRRIIRDDLAAGLLPEGHQRVMHGLVHLARREDRHFRRERKPPDDRLLVSHSVWARVKERERASERLQAVYACPLYTVSE